MCPECGAECEWNGDVDLPSYACHKCSLLHNLLSVYWGCHAPDIAGVVAEIRDTYDGSCVCDNCYPLEDKINDINGWADRLEGKHE
jgi:hypothetical protein